MRAIPIVLVLACGSGSPGSDSKTISALTSGATCDGRWHWVDVDGTFCGDGSPTGFQYICRGSADGPLLVYLDGGGACWSADTCDLSSPDTTIVTDHVHRADS